MASNKCSRLISIDAAAEWLGGLSPWTIRAWIRDGKIQVTCLIGSRRMIPVSEIERLIEEGRNAASRARA